MYILELPVVRNSSQVNGIKLSMGLSTTQAHRFSLMGSLLGIMDNKNSHYVPLSSPCGCAHGLHLTAILDQLDF